MSANQQALLMASSNAVLVPAACVADAYYSCGPTNDPYWANVVLMLHMDGSFADSSTNALTPTVTNATTTTSAPKFGAGCGTFDGNGDRVAFTNAILALGTGDYTIEFWIKPRGVPSGSQDYLFGNTTGSPFIDIRYQTTGSLVMQTGEFSYPGVSASALTVGAWQHVAFVRASGSTRGYLNGVAGPSSATDTTNYTMTTLYVGAANTNDSFSFDGEIDDLRITKGIARYTGNFNIPTAAFPDAVDINYFTNGVVYNSSSGYFPSESGVTAGATFTTDKSGAFTWVVPGTATACYTRTPSPIRLKSYCEFVCTTQPATMTHSFGVQRANVAQFYDARGGMMFSGNGGCGLGAAGYSNEGVETTNAAYSFTTNDVIGVAFDPFTGKLWFSKNGTWISGDPEAGTSPTMTLALGEYYFAFGAYSCLIASGTYEYKIQPSAENQTHAAPVGFIEYADYVKARTVLSLHAEDTDDSSCYQPKTVTLAGSAAVSTDEKKFDTASFSVANAGTSTANGVVITDHMDFDFGTGDFTIEMWAYRSSNTYYGTLFYFTEAAEFSLLVAPTTGNIVLNYRSSGGTQANISTGVTFPLTTWQHVVVQRRGTNFEFYLNGVLGNTTAITGGASSTVNSAGNFYLGRTNASSALTWAGYIDEVRITKGVARIANPNLPTEAFPDSAPDDPYWDSVVLMLPMAVDFSDSSETTKTVTPAGDAQITAISPKFGTGSGLFDGTGDLLSVTHVSELTLGTSDFTFEAWIRLSEINRWHGIIGNGTGAGAIDFVVATTPNNFLRVYANSGTLNLNAVTALVIDTWYHVALVRSGDVFTIFLNGVTESTATVAVTLSATSAWKIAGDYTSTPLKGQMAYARVTKGVARYPTSFTPPAQPNCDSVVPGNIVAVPGTSPLTGMSVVVQQQSIGDQNGAVALSNTVIDIGPPLEYRVNRADVFAGNLTVSSVATDKTVALTGRSVTVSRGTLAVPAYPNLISVSTTTIEAVATGNTAKLTFTFFTDGTYTVVDQALTTRTSGTWIDTAQTNYSIPAISNQYRVVTINIFAGTSYTYSTLPFTLGTSFSVVIQNLASSTLNIFDFQLTISPTSTNPRYAEPYYYGTHRFKAVLSNDMS